MTVERRVEHRPDSLAGVLYYHESTPSASDRQKRRVLRPELTFFRLPSEVLHEVRRVLHEVPRATNHHHISAENEFWRELSPKITLNKTPNPSAVARRLAAGDSTRSRGKADCAHESKAKSGFGVVLRAAGGNFL